VTQRQIRRAEKRRRHAAVERCCELWHPNYGCPHEICPGCYCSKRHDENVCEECHTFNLDHAPYLAKYGVSNVRKES